MQNYCFAVHCSDSISKVSRLPKHINPFHHSMSWQAVVAVAYEKRAEVHLSSHNTNRSYLGWEIDIAVMLESSNQQYDFHGCNL